MKLPKSYQLTPSLIAASVGAGVWCVATEGVGRVYRLHARRPDASANLRAFGDGAALKWRADLPSGAAHVISPVAAKPGLIRVDISGPLEQRAGYHDPCAGWTDGYDAIAERLCAAFTEADVVLYVDSPGGAAAGIQQCEQIIVTAKQKHGRRVTGFVNESAGSAAVWLMMAICDEIFVPVAGKFGSVGARCGHMDISGALAKEGVKPTFFADPPDKIAFAPELPLSEVALARGNRDVKIVGDAFRASVCASPIGQRSKLTPEFLYSLGADMLTGQAAVDAGLVDGVCTESDFIAYALKQAERASTTNGGIMPDEQEEALSPNAEGGAAAEDPLPDAMCSCGVQNKAGAKFCADCGQSLAVSTEEPAEEEAPPPSSKPAAKVAVARMNPSASFAEIFGLPASASLPAQKAAALDYQQVFALAATLTGQSSAAGILGGLTAMSDDAAESGRLRKEVSNLTKAADKKERWDLCSRLVKVGAAGHERGKVFVDAVDAKGVRIIDPKTRKPVIRIAPMYAEMKLPTLRGLVEGYERNVVPRSPYEPDKAAAEAATNGRPQEASKKARIEAAKSLANVIKIANDTGRPIEAVAEQWVAAIDAQTGGAS